MDGAIWSAEPGQPRRAEGGDDAAGLHGALTQQAVPRDTSLLTFLETYIPEPASLVASNVSERPLLQPGRATTTRRTLAGFAPFDSVAATDGFPVDIVAPLQEAQTLFDNSPYLTRLATFISPPQMTKDPLFLFNSDLGDVSNVQAAQAVYECGNQQYIDLRCADPADVARRQRRAPAMRRRRRLTPASDSRARSPATVVVNSPALATAWQRRAVGTGVVVADNTAMIAAQWQP